MLSTRAHDSSSCRPLSPYALCFRGCYKANQEDCFSEDDIGGTFHTKHYLCVIADYKYRFTVLLDRNMLVYLPFVLRVCYPKVYGNIFVALECENALINGFGMHVFFI